MTREEIGDWALHAYVDNEVSGEQRDEIEALLRADHNMAQKVDAWRRQRDLLHQAFDAVAAEPLPPSLRATLRSGGHAPWLPYAAMAAAIALFYLEDLTVAEIAVALATPPGTVKTRLMHARQKLRRSLNLKETDHG